ncbi:sperm flagellar protein 1-like, partial [Chrysoperla carnea]|uniref:sperm flagellar protein 1-like n=1 Tax=Chrysoperla carnea TaxID=189513 RepID=UPI001D06F774
MVDLCELHAWIDTHSFSRPKRNLNRDFADGVLLAELLKYHYPNLVELHNYSPQNSLQRKIDNWETLNRKVLKKLKLGITKAMMEQIATAHPGAIEKVLARLKTKIEQENMCKRDKDDDSEHSDISEVTGASIRIPIRVKNDNNDEMVVEQKMSVDIIARKFEELEEKNEAVKILNQKVEHLDCLIRLKDQRIEDLTRQLQKYHSFGQ